MDVNFEASREDQMDVLLRTVQRSGSLTSQRRNSLIIVALAAFIIPFLIFAERPIALRLVVAVVAAGLSLAVYPLFYRSALKRSLNSILKEQLGEVDRFQVKVAINDDGLRFDQLGRSVVYQWQNVEAVENLEDRVDFYMRSRDLATVRAQAFESPQQRQAFVSMAEEFIAAAANDQEPS
jgi:hypothetical protein